MSYEIFHADCFDWLRERGMKVVAFDPICSPTASKADQWIPLRPGTDGAVVEISVEVKDKKQLERVVSGIRRMPGIRGHAAAPTHGRCPGTCCTDMRIASYAKNA